MSNASSIFQPNTHLYLLHTFIFITFLLHVPECYVHHLHGELSAFYIIVFYVGCVIRYKIYTFVQVLTMIETISCSVWIRKTN